MKNTGILKDVKEWLDMKVSDGYTEKQALEELQNHGCVSGIVGHLIYYYDSCRFYNKHRREIIALTENFCEMSGEGLKEFLLHANNFPMNKQELGNETFVTGISGLIRKNKDIADQIKNWFAWFGFEETAYNYYCEKYEN